MFWRILQNFPVNTCDRVHFYYKVVGNYTKKFWYYCFSKTNWTTISEASSVKFLCLNSQKNLWIRITDFQKHHQRYYMKNLQACNFIKKRLHHGCFPVNIVKFSKTPILRNICERLLVFLKVALLSKIDLKIYARKYHRNSYSNNMRWFKNIKSKL